MQSTTNHTILSKLKLRHILNGLKTTLAFDVKDALETIEDALETPKVHSQIVDISDLGRQMEGYIIAKDYEHELCVWHEKELCESLLEQEK